MISEIILMKNYEENEKDNEKEKGNENENEKENVFWKKKNQNNCIEVKYY